MAYEISKQLLRSDSELCCWCYASIEQRGHLLCLRSTCRLDHCIWYSLQLVNDFHTKTRRNVGRCEKRAENRQFEGHRKPELGLLGFGIAYNWRNSEHVVSCAAQTQLVADWTKDLSLLPLKQTTIR